MKVIRLNKGQRRRLEFKHPLLDGVKKSAKEELNPILMLVRQGNRQARDDLILAHMIYVRNIVGRFLAHWPETRRFQDDMVSEGLLSITKCVDSLGPEEDLNQLQARIWNTIKDDIEYFLNEFRSTFAASRRTNYRRVESSSPLEYAQATSYVDGFHSSDMDLLPQYIDMMDELENFISEDVETLRIVVYTALADERGMEIDSLSKEELDMIDTIIDVMRDIS